MQNRIIQFLKEENITQSQFADEIGVARASVSHIIAGRNKPGCDFIARMASHYPALNLDWLLLGTGNMYKSSDRTVPQQIEIPSAPITEQIQSPQPQRPAQDNPIASLSGPKQRSAISKVIVFYTDGTYQEMP